MWLKIRWPYGFEYVDLGGFSRTAVARRRVLQTYDVDAGVKGRRNDYNAVAERGPDGATIDLIYERARNLHLGRAECDRVEWGRTRIGFDSSGKPVTVAWFGEAGSLPSLRFEVLDDELEGQLLRRVARQVIARDEQQRLKRALLKLDQCCAVSRETTPSALDAAHILSVGARRGISTEANAILLRADLHRLFDAGAFRFNQSGGVIAVSPKLSVAYRTLLRKAHLSPDVLERCRQAIRLSAGRLRER